MGATTRPQGSCAAHADAQALAARRVRGRARGLRMGRRAAPGGAAALAGAARAGAAGANGALALTSRNSLPPLRAALADRFPDLIESSEGGSNMMLVRAPGADRGGRAAHAGARARAARAAARPGRDARRPPAGRGEPAPVGAARPARARRSCCARPSWRWSSPGADPLIFGGDLNLRPAQPPRAFEELERRFGLAAPTGAEGDRPPARARPRAWSRRRTRSRRRRARSSARRAALRLSDHAPVVGRVRHEIVRSGRRTAEGRHQAQRESEGSDTRWRSNAGAVKSKRSSSSAQSRRPSRPPQALGCGQEGRGHPARPAAQEALDRGAKKARAPSGRRAEQRASPPRASPSCARRLASG